MDVIYFDIAKAFDKLDHHTLLIKLAKLGTPYNILKLIANYLNGRNYKIYLEGNPYLSLSTNCGVPQGSHIGPLLFIAVCADIINYITNSKISQFADDTKLYLSIKKETDVNILQNDINNFSKWCSDNKLEINATKTTHVLYSKSSNKPTKAYYLNGVVISPSDTVVDLGVTFDSSLNFKPQFANIVLKATQLMGFIWRKNKIIKNKQIMITLFKSIVLPVIEYASTVWMSPMAPEMKLLEQIQRKFTRMILKIPPNPSLPNYMNYNTRLTKLNLLSIDQRLKISQLIMAKKLKLNPERVPSLNDYINLNLSNRNLRTKCTFELKKATTNFALRQPMSALQSTYNTYQHLINEVEAHSTTRAKLKNYFNEINKIE